MCKLQASVLSARAQDQHKRLSDEVVQKNLNSYDININWKKEADLRMYNHMEKALTEYVSSNMKEYYRDDDKAYHRASFL